MKKRKLRLKKKWKDLLIYLIIVTCGVALMFGVIDFYNWRVEQTKGQKPSSINISEIFKK